MLLLPRSKGLKIKCADQMRHNRKSNVSKFPFVNWFKKTLHLRNARGDTLSLYSLESSAEACYLYKFITIFEKFETSSLSKGLFDLIGTLVIKNSIY